MPSSTTATSSVVRFLGFSKLLLLPVLLLLLATPASAHFAVTYPPWRGNSIPTQWTYPCMFLPSVRPSPVGGGE